MKPNNTGFFSLPFRAILALLAAAAISFFSAYMSVVGMYALFPAAGWVILGTMISIEIAKFITAESAYDDWKERGNTFKKIYKTMAVTALMAITAMGVYGFLAKGHLEQSAPIAPVQLEIAQKETRIAQLNGELSRLSTQQNQLNASVDAMIKNSATARDARAGLRARNGSAIERRDVQDRIDTINAEINTVTQELVPLRMKVSEVSAKLGPLQYVADLFGWKDPEAAVRMIILLLMFAFDPLAIVLMIDGTERLAAWARDRDTPRDEPEDEDAEEDDDDMPGPIEEIPSASDNSSADLPEPEVTDTAPSLFYPSPGGSLWTATTSDSWSPNIPGEGKLLPELMRIAEERKAAEIDDADEEQPEELDEKQKLIDILDRNPELLEEVIEAVQELRSPPPSEWLTPKGDN